MIEHVPSHFAHIASFYLIRYNDMWKTDLGHHWAINSILSNDARTIHHGWLNRIGVA